MVADALALKDMAMAAIADRKGVDAVALPVASLTDVTDYMVIASGTSNRHVRAIVDHLLQMAKEHGVAVLGTEGRERSEWVLVDLADVVVHVMRAQTRAFYDLERLWETLEPVRDAQGSVGVAAAEPATA